MTIEPTWPPEGANSQNYKRCAHYFDTNFCGPISVDAESILSVDREEAADLPSAVVRLSCRQAVALVGFAHADAQQKFAGCVLLAASYASANFYVQLKTRRSPLRFDHLGFGVPARIRRGG